MSDKTSTDRDALLKVAALIRPALATSNYIPAFQHIKFDGDFATAYNDISAISVRMKTDVRRCIPGELLIRALGSFNADNVAFSEGKNGALTISSGRSRVTVPTLDLKAFPLVWPEDGDVEVKLSAAILKGIARCLLSVGSDPTHPEQMGVTLESQGGKAVLYSTDNFSISRFSTDSKLKLPGDSPIILPTFLCEQLSSLARAFPDETPTLLVMDGALVVEFGDSARLLTKTLVDREPLDFPAIFKKHMKADGDLKKELATIPDAFDSALQRALLVLGSEQDKVTTVTFGDEKIAMSSSSSMGDSDDKMPFDCDAAAHAPEEVFFDPALVARASKHCGLLGFMPRALVLADSEAQFVHLVAYCSK